jgi:hypothetical protein
MRVEKIAGGYLEKQRDAFSEQKEENEQHQPDGGKT